VAGFLEDDFPPVLQQFLGVGDDEGLPAVVERGAQGDVHLAITAPEIHDVIGFRRIFTVGIEERLGVLLEFVSRLDTAGAADLRKVGVADELAGYRPDVQIVPGNQHVAIAFFVLLRHACLVHAKCSILEIESRTVGQW
jgi:hypothetical protein